MAESPRVGEKLLHEMPARAPEVPTQARPCRRDAATVLGNSPGTATGWSTRERRVGSEGEMESMLSVLEPALTAKMNCQVVVWCHYGIFGGSGLVWGTHIARNCQSRLAHQRVRSRWLFFGVQRHRTGPPRGGHTARGEPAVGSNRQRNYSIGIIVGDEVDCLSYCASRLCDRWTSALALRSRAACNLQCKDDQLQRRSR